MHSNLNFHAAQAEIPRVSSTHMLKSLAEKALKHIPGAQEVIQRSFSTSPIVPEIKAKKPMNLVYHMPH